MLRNEMRRKLKVEGDIIIFYFIFYFLFFSEVYFTFLPSCCFCWVDYIRFRSRYARALTVDGLRKKTRKFQKQEKQGEKGI